LKNKRKHPLLKFFSHEEHPFKDWTEDELKSLLGVIQMKKPKFQVPPKQVTDNTRPAEFDSRTQWPGCVHKIRDQGKCGSCWAHAASEVLSDRFCIASNGTIDVELSPQDMVSCDWLDHGCSGGILTTSWAYLYYWGVVTDSCKPYTSGTGQVEWCGEKKCKNENEPYVKYFAKNFKWLNSVEKIKDDIVAHGPVETGFQVYADFMSYKGGIYRKGKEAKFLGGHAVKIIGWGREENGSEHWIVANSWNTKWGEEGFFRIAHGECSIENAIAGEAYIK